MAVEKINYVERRKRFVETFQKDPVLISTLPKLTADLFAGEFGVSIDDLSLIPITWSVGMGHLLKFIHSQNAEEFAGVQAPEPPFGRRHKQQRADDGARDGAYAAENHHEQDLIGHGGLKVIGLRDGEHHGKRRARDTREEGTRHEGDHLVLCKVDAHGLRCHLVVTDGLEGAAVGGVHDQDNQEDGYCGDQHRYKS